MRAIVERAGFLTSVQDVGRTGFREAGVSTSGALDSFALRVANLLVGNDEGAAALEITLGGLRLRFNDERIVAWCGGEFDVQADSRPLPPGHGAHLQAGDELKFGLPKIGCRAWLAISGGIDLPKVLESRSTDLRTEFGGLDGRALRPGDVIPLGRQTNAAQDVSGLLRKEIVSTWSAPVHWTSTAIPSPTLRFVRGGNWNCFEPSAHENLVGQSFSVSPDSNRMGARLDGPLLLRNDYADMISEAVAPGTVQVPPNAKPILLLGDCQTIGGYPKIAHVVSVDLALAAQLRAGDQVRFREIPLPEAQRLLLQRERDLGLFRVGLEARAA